MLPLRKTTPVLCAISCGLVSCAATLPVGTVNGHADSRYSRSTPPVSALDRPETPRHQVRRGETLWRIARANGCSVEMLAKLNGIDNPSSLRVGQVLRLPGEEARDSPGDALARVRERVLSEREPSDPEDGGKSTTAAGPAKTTSAQPSRRVPGKPSKRVSVARYPLRWPLKGEIVRRYGRKGKRHHDGIDILAGSGVPVVAAASGKVVFADEHGGYGKLVLVRHESGLITVYAHHSELLVKKGQHVSGGDTIARVGSTGNAKTPHLHFEVRKGVATQNPLQFLPP